MQANSSIENTDSKQLEFQDPPIATFKMIIIGDSKVGKSTFIKRFSRGVLEERVINDHKITIHHTQFTTNFGVIEFNVWDIDEPSVEAETPEEFFMGADCAILMFDATSRISYKSLPMWYMKIHKFNEKTVVTLVGNKVDIKERKVKIKVIMFHKKKNLTYHDISVRANHKIEQPFVDLMRILTSASGITLIENPVVQPPECVMDEELVERYEDELSQLEAYVLPDDDDDY